MADNAKLTQLVTTAMGVPATPTKVRTTTTSASATLVPSGIYRLAATEDAFFNLTNATTAATDNDNIVFGGIPEIIQTTDSAYILNALQVTASGDLRISKMARALT